MITFLLLTNANSIHFGPQTRASVSPPTAAPLLLPSSGARGNLSSWTLPWTWDPGQCWIKASFQGTQTLKRHSQSSSVPRGITGGKK